MPCYPNVLIQRLIQSVNLIELWYKAEKSGQSDVWKKAISVRRIYPGGRKQGHVAMGWIFQFPQTLVNFSPTVNMLSCYILINFNNNDKQIGVHTLCLLK